MNFSNQRPALARGFTLIEIIVVVGIIGVLVSVITISSQEARNNAKDKRIKAAMGEMRLDAKLYYERYKNYGTENDRDNDRLSCSGQSNMNNTVFKYSDSLSLSESVLLVEETADGRVYCAATPNGWAFAAPLYNQAAEGNSWCVDSSGYEGMANINLDGDGNYIPFTVEDAGGNEVIPNCSDI